MCHTEEAGGDGAGERAIYSQNAAKGGWKDFHRDTRWRFFYITGGIKELLVAVPEILRDINFCSRRSMTSSQ